VVSEDQRAPAERFIDNAVEDAEGLGRPLSRTSMQYQRSIENYLKAGNRPRWMERLVEIDTGVARERRRLEAAYGRLREETGGDAGAFARRWRETAERWDFGGLEVLVQQHNEWYPIERQLPIDLRTRDYVKIRGRSYRRPELDAAWILEQFPAELR
jgi:hypothetical protein